MIIELNGSKIITEPQPKSRNKEQATRSSWKNFPIQNPKKTIVDLKFSRDQFFKIKEGLVPQVMEDKWFIFLDADQINIHRSWTGYGIFRANFIESEGNFLIKEIYTESDFMSLSQESEIVSLFTQLLSGLMEDPS